MTEEKKTKKRRPADEIAAEKTTWLIRHTWAGPKRALEIVREALSELEEAAAACGDKVDEAAPMWKTVQSVLAEIDNAIDEAIPPEAR